MLFDSTDHFVNPIPAKPVKVDDGRLTIADFRKTRIAELIEAREDKSCRQAYSPMWQPDKLAVRSSATSSPREICKSRCF